MRKTKSMDHTDGQYWSQLQKRFDQKLEELYSNSIDDGSYTVRGYSQEVASHNLFGSSSNNNFGPVQFGMGSANFNIISEEGTPTSYQGESITHADVGDEEVQSCTNLLGNMPGIQDN